MKGLVHIYTGDGKGKTTAALGLGMRACGRGLKVLMVQFLKGAPTGEMKTIERLNPDFVLYRSKDVKGFIWNMDAEQRKKLQENTHEALGHAFTEAMTGKWDLLILDEVMGAIQNKLLDSGEIIRLITQKPEELELVLTGRNAPPELVELADYVSEIHAVKHPMDKGIPARTGIEC